MTTRPFVPPPRVPPPEAGGGKIAVEPPIAAPVPPPRSIWGIVLPIGLIVGVLGFIIAMYVSGQRSLATGFAIFPLIMLMSMGGMLGAAALRQQRLTGGSDDSETTKS